MIPKDPPDRYDRYGFRIENYDLYKPKKYYIEPENEEELKKKLDALENELKQYKHHEDLQRYFFLHSNFSGFSQTAILTGKESMSLRNIYGLDL